MSWPHHQPLLSTPCQGGQKCVQLSSSPWCSTLPRKRDHCHRSYKQLWEPLLVFDSQDDWSNDYPQCVCSMDFPKPSGRELCDDLVMPVVAWRRLSNTTTMTTTAAVLLLWWPRWLWSTPPSLSPPLATLPATSTPNPFKNPFYLINNKVPQWTLPASLHRQEQFISDWSHFSP